MTHRRSRGFAGNRAEEFVKLPKKSEFPDYYELVDTPKALVKQPRLIDESARTDRNRTKRFRTHGRSWVFYSASKFGFSSKSRSLSLRPTDPQCCD